jgi:hypothetical protein
VTERAEAIPAFMRLFDKLSSFPEFRILPKNVSRETFSSDSSPKPYIVTDRNPLQSCKIARIFGAKEIAWRRPHDAPNFFQNATAM